MKTVAELCYLARENLPKKGLNASWYRLARYIEVSDQSLTGYKQGKCVWSDKTAEKIAELLPFPKEIVVLWTRMEREENPIMMALLQQVEATLNAA